MSGLLTELLDAAIRRGASDLHLSARRPPFIRVNGDIVTLPVEPLDGGALAHALEAIMTEEHQKAWRTTRQVCFTWIREDLGFFRVNLYSHLGQLEAAIRIGKSQVETLKSLGAPELLAELVRRPSGLILITGATGVGKTTTLNALLSRVNQEDRCKIITIEDPVEFVHPPGKSLLVQQEIGLDCDNFEGAVRHALRQDPDILCIGEMRDLETIRTALTAAETGHLVVATLHTTGAVGTISRVIDVFPPEQQNQIRLALAQGLVAVFSQRLLPRANGKGRMLVYELMIVNDAIKNLIRENKPQMIQSVIQTNKAAGMQDMDFMIRDTYLAGDITFETASSVISNVKLLAGR